MSEPPRRARAADRCILVGSELREDISTIVDSGAVGALSALTGSGRITTASPNCSSGVSETNAIDWLIFFIQL